VHLKKLELLGFKSFADRTEFRFERGVTGIVGPNGCGKSNVVDAFKWIFGTQSAKGLRGSEMKDVIFNGTQTRRPTGFAEVTVVFDNEDRFLDVDFAEVAITRRLFRSGESEYLLNKQRCRLKDLKDLFLDTGIGTASYSLLEQGKIDVLLQSSTSDRRVIFEEAAGISKYRVRKAEALRSLLRVEENLKRLQDILDEVEKRVRRVKVQAAKARRYRAYDEQLKELRIRVAVEDYRRSAQGRTELAFQLWWVRHSAERAERLLQRLSRALDEHALRRQAVLAEVQDLSGQLADERAVRERIEERHRQASRRIEELEVERERKRGELDKARESTAQLRKELERQQDQVRSLRSELSAMEGRLSEKEVSLKHLAAVQSEAEDELRRRKEDVVDGIQRRSKLLNVVVQVEAELNNLRGRGQRLETTLGGFRAELEAWEAKREELRQKQGALDALQARLECESATISARAAEVDVQVREAQADFEAADGELRMQRARLEVLQGFEAELQGIASGVAGVLKRQGELALKSRTHGLVASLLRVERRYAPAVEAALGDKAQALVVESQEGALELLDFIRAERLGRVEVLALDRIEPPQPAHCPKGGGVLGPLRELVELADGMAEVADRLLQGVVLVEDFATAVALSRNGLKSYRLVTLDGEVVDPCGSFIAHGAAEPGIISRRSEMDDLLTQVRGLESQCGRLREQWDGLGAVQHAVGAAREANGAQREEIARKRIALDGEVNQARREVERIEREIRVGSTELASLDAEINGQVRELEACRQQVEAADADVQAAEEAVCCLEARTRLARQDVEVSTDAVGSLRLESAQARKQEEGLNRLVQQLVESCEERGRQAAALEGEISLVETRALEAQETVGESDRLINEGALRQESLEVALRQREAQDGELRDIERALRQESERLHSRQRELAKAKESHELRDQEERHKRNTVLERIDEAYGIDIRQLLDRTSAPLPSVAGAENAESPAAVERGVEEGLSGMSGMSDTAGDSPGTRDSRDAELRLVAPLSDEQREAARLEIKDLQEKMHRLGNVNLEALEELDELEERHEFQLAQKRDLVESERNLRSIIGDINAKSRELFLSTFSTVQGHFNDLFRKCFGGGKAELVLEEGADVLEAGVEIIARPPGKKLTSLSLMSGGEKTMTTLALLLAIFRSRPSPICVLDEVDAALDETNVRRFVVLLREFAQNSQFIIITHNKVTMAEAATLYGVTMEERGVSKRVTVELESYEPQERELVAATPA
jgi:chromosome segregation protein